MQQGETKEQRQTRNISNVGKKRAERNKKCTSLHGKMKKQTKFLPKTKSWE